MFDVLRNTISQLLRHFARQKGPGLRCASVFLGDGETSHGQGQWASRRIHGRVLQSKMGDGRQNSHACEIVDSVELIN